MAFLKNFCNRLQILVIDYIFDYQTKSDVVVAFLRKFEKNHVEMPLNEWNSRQSLHLMHNCRNRLHFFGGMMVKIVDVARPVSYTHLTLPTSDLV